MRVSGEMTRVQELRNSRTGVGGSRVGRCAFLRQRAGARRSVCRARASFRVGVTLRERRSSPGVTIYVKLICCSACARQLTKNDVLTKTGFRKMASFVFEKHQMTAKWSRTEVAFTPL